MSSSLGSYKVGSRITASKQRGVVLVLGMVGMVAILAVAGLALDGGRLTLSKNRLQNLADQAALAGAKEYDLSGDPTLATAAVTEAITQNDGLAGAVASGALTVTTEFSPTLNPYTPSDGPFVRVALSNFQLPAFLLPVIGIDSLTAGATAVSGPSPPLDDTVCDVAPIMACARSDVEFDDNGTTGTDDDLYWGYGVGEVALLKQGTSPNMDQLPVGCNFTMDDWAGAGNFHLARIGDDSGGNDVRFGLAGGSVDACIAMDADNPTDLPLESQPGNMVGPTRAIDSRFGDYGGGGVTDAEAYPSDCDTREPEVPIDLCNYKNYLDDYPDFNGNLNQYQNNPPASCLADNTGAGRRMLKIPIVTCPVGNGQSVVEAKGVMCVYLVQRSGTGCGDGIKGVGGAGGASCIFAQMAAECNGFGTFDETPDADSSERPLPTRIILYKDVDNVDA